MRCGLAFGRRRVRVKGRRRSDKDNMMDRTVRICAVLTARQRANARAPRTTLPIVSLQPNTHLAVAHCKVSRPKLGGVAYVDICALLPLVRSIRSKMKYSANDTSVVSSCQGELRDPPGERLTSSMLQRLSGGEQSCQCRCLLP